MDEDIERSVKGVARGAGILIVGAFASKAIMYFYRLVVARYLGSADYGLLSLALAVFWVSVTFSTLSVPSGVNRFVSRFIGEEKEDRVKGVVVSAAQLTLPMSLVVASVLLVAAPTISSRVFDNPGLTIYLRIFALAIPFQVVYQIVSSVAEAYKRMEYIAAVDKLYRSLATLLVTVALVFAGYGLLGAVVAQLVAIITASMLILYLVEFRVFPVLRREGNGFRNRRELFHYSYPLLLGSIIGLFTGWTDTVMLGFFDTASNVGIYNAALPTAQLMSVVGIGFANILFPTVSTLYGEGKKQESVTVASTAIKWMFAAAFPMLAIMVFFSRPMLRLLFGNVYAAGGLALSVLAVAYFVSSMSNYAGQFIKSEDRTKLLMFNSIAVSVLNVALNWVLIQHFMGTSFGSQTGAGIATAVSLAFGGLLAVGEAYVIFGVQPFRVRRLLPAFFAGVLSAVIVYAGVKAVHDPTPAWLLVPGFAAFAVLYAVFFLLFGGLEEEDVMVLNAVERKSGMDLSRLRRLVKKIAR